MHGINALIDFFKSKLQVKADVSKKPTLLYIRMNSPCGLVQAPLIFWTLLSLSVILKNRMKLPSTKGIVKVRKISFSCMASSQILKPLLHNYGLERRRQVHRLWSWQDFFNLFLLFKFTALRPSRLISLSMSFNSVTHQSP